MVIKTVTLTIETDYLQRVAKQRGISRSRLVRILIEKIMRDRLVEEIVTDADVTADARSPRYRRFPLKTGR